VARRRLKLRLTPQDADRIFGKQWAAKWRKRHRRRGSKGPKSKRWKRIKAALENYVPEVKVGNQTALKTRAHPYARYIAAMHRKIHPLWGHGFLQDLDLLPAHHAFNDWSRNTKIELVLDNRGRLVKAGVVKPSGFLPFDVAALDVVFQAAPFGPPPAAIRSPDGRVYLHWGFYRNHRQCGTFNVDPFILASPPDGPKDRGSADGPSPRPRRTGRALRRRQNGSATPDPRARGSERARRAARRAARQLGATLDPKARGPAAAWITGFLQGKVNRMLRASAVPFRVATRRATTRKQLRSIYLALIAETPDRHLERAVQLHTAAGLRKRLGTLPRGIQPGSPHLYVVARYMKNDLVLILGKRDGRWAVVGLAR
jgi:TonB family protein